ncbi:protein transporter Sec39 [Ascosphaera apis ARSEF 7405]|uniref:Protein transporter Sec39 n=1 Tax=Ascosphaera apis ARSEF 7405 TaxID=392613 RepID=A0A168AWB9_9EURO|nr:protein transporter Sec39 [Ascosphaera apis ARSEF 7405]
MTATGLEGLSDAHIVLLAVQQCLHRNISTLPYLRSRSRQVLTPELCYRIILTFLPETVHPNEYTYILEKLDQDAVDDREPVDLDVGAVTNLSASKAAKRVNRLKLLPLRCPGAHIDIENDNKKSLVEFLIHRAHRIDSETGLQPYILELVGPFLHISTSLRDWTVSTVLPLLRLNYEYFPDRIAGNLSLHIIESFDAASAVNFLLSGTETQAHGGQVGRDLRGLVGPWIYGACANKRRKSKQNDYSGSIDDWNEINEWLLSTSRRDFELAVEAVEQWGGPSDVHFGGYLGDQASPMPQSLLDELRKRYAQTAIACIYATTESGPEVLAGSSKMLSRIAHLMGYDGNLHLYINTPDLRPIPLDHASIPSIARPHLLQNSLSHPSNVLTSPNQHTFAFLDALLVSIRTLNKLGHVITCRTAADVCLLADEELQMLEFKSILEAFKLEKKGKRDWSATRDMLLWLRDWCREGSQRVPGRGLFWRLDQNEIEKLILQSMLLGEQQKLAVEIYAKEPRQTTLDMSDVEATVVSTILHCYDNATNGNKTRGRMKLASEILQAFSPYFPSTISFKRIRNLIEVTHSLSFYALTLQHGVPFQPVSIRVHKDPLSLIEKVLEQNKKAYVRVQDLLVIGRQLVAAGFRASEDDGKMVVTTNEGYDLILMTPRPTDEEARETKIAERRIISMAITSALDLDDFETANSFVMTRIAPPPSAFKKSSPDEVRDGDDDISWRAIFKAGNYRSQSLATAPLYKQIHRLSQRMELLSLTLLLVPSPKHLNEILAAWRRCDEEMKILRQRESEEEEEWAHRSDRIRMSGEMERPSRAGTTMPGGFASSSQSRRRNTEEDAPMGLFDVARGAARAFRKNAFPLRAKLDLSSATATAPPTGSALVSATESRTSTPLSDKARNSGELPRSESAASDHAKRPRKRDMVSSMVTGGLASGLGWVLGAQPVLRRESDADRTESQSEKEKDQELYDELGRGIGGNDVLSPVERQTNPTASTAPTHYGQHEEAGNDWDANWGDDDNEQHTTNTHGTTAANDHTDEVEVDDAWEANWGGDEEGVEEEETTSAENKPQTSAAPIHSTTTPTPAALHKKDDVEEVGEDWEANWGWD